MLKKKFIIHNDDLLVALDGNLDRSDVTLLKNYISYFKTTYNVKNIIFDTRKLNNELNFLEELDDETV